SRDDIRAVDDTRRQTMGRDLPAYDVDSRLTRSSRVARAIGGRTDGGSRSGTGYGDVAIEKRRTVAASRRTRTLRVALHRRRGLQESGSYGRWRCIERGRSAHIGKPASIRLVSMR